MKTRLIRLGETDSTNRWLRDYRPADADEMTIVVASHQTAGRGCGTNTWESESGKNLLCSISVRVEWLPVARQFLLSMAHALALRSVLCQYADAFSLKWPNDVYWRDRKICGTLIELGISQGAMGRCIFGTGLNVNQREFVSDAPNPVSLAQILGHEVDVEEVLQGVVGSFSDWLQVLREGRYAEVSAAYHAALYRREGVHRYRDASGEFMATIAGVADNGQLTLIDAEHRERRYAFKEVAWLPDLAAEKEKGN